MLHDSIDPKLGNLPNGWNSDCTSPVEFHDLVAKILKIVDYRIISSIFLYEFKEGITKAISDGYIFNGDLKITPSKVGLANNGDWSEYINYTREMVKYG